MNRRSFMKSALAVAASAALSLGFAPRRPRLMRDLSTDEVGVILNREYGKAMSDWISGKSELYAKLPAGDGYYTVTAIRRDRDTEIITLEEARRRWPSPVRLPELHTMLRKP